MADFDSKGYYRVLGVSSSASADEIRTAFRGLAKKFHPDRNPAPGSPRIFQAIHEAYETLRDARRRSQYDGLSYEPRAQERPTGVPSPIVCSRCGRITAQPRYVIYHYVVSALFTFRRSIQGIFCAACSKRKALAASAISAIAGWWGVYGPIHTVREIIQNARGGYQPQELRDRLLWTNARAFVGIGNVELSYALARDLRASNTDDIADGAEQLIEALKACGVGEVPHLKNQWRFSLEAALLHLGLLLAVPAALIAGVRFEPMIRTITNSAMTTSDASHSALRSCDTPPLNGQVLEDNTTWTQSVNAMKIQNRSGHDAIIKIRDAASGKTLISFFVANNATARFDLIPDGTYRIQYAFGKKLDEACMRFVSRSTAAEFPDAQTFTTHFQGIEIIHQVASYTLDPVSAGNVHPNTIDTGAFNAP